MKIVEMFSSIQSEGTHAGTPATFIRFYGCNLQCQFTDKLKCDEPLHTKTEEIKPELDLKAISARCAGTRHVVITGGEPSLNNINDLIEALQDRGHYVQIETNGYNYENMKKANWITYSPKLPFDREAPVMQFGFHELKLLASPEHPPVTGQWSSIRAKYIQPIGLEDGWDMNNVKWCHDWVVANPTWKLSLQVHKIYGAE